MKSVRFAAFFVLLGCVDSQISWADNPAPDFYGNVLPILQANCIACHNLQKAEGGLNLESFEAAQKGGDSGLMYAAGKSSESSLIRRVKGEEELMPPAGNTVGAKQLSNEQIQVLAAWIDAGAVAGVKSTKPSMQWQSLPESVRPIYAITASSDGQFAALGRGNQALVYRWPTSATTDVTILADASLAPIHGRPTAHHDLIQSIAMSPDATRVATGGYRDIKIWKRLAGQIEDEFAAKLRGSRHIESSSNGLWVARSTSSPTLEILDGSTGTILYRWDQPQQINSFAWSPDNTKLVVNTHEGVLHTLTLPAEKPASTLPITATSSQPVGIAFAELHWLGTQTVVGRLADNKVHVWKSVPQQDKPALWERVPILESVANVTSIACFGENKIAMSILDGSVIVANYPDGATALTIPVATPIRVFWNSDATRLFSVGTDGITRAWNVADGKQLWENQLDRETGKRIESAEIELARQKARVDRANAKLPELEKAKTAENENRTKVQKSRDEANEALAKKVAELEAAKKTVTDSETNLANAMKALEEAKKLVEQNQKDVESKKQQVAMVEKTKGEAETKVTTLNNTLVAADEAVNKSVATLSEFQLQLEKEKTNLASLEQKHNEVKASAKPLRATHASISPDRQSLLTLFEGGKLSIIRSENGMIEQSFMGSLDGSSSLCATFNGRVFQTHADGRAVSWHIGNQWSIERTIGSAEDSPFSDRITAMTFSHDGQSLIVGSGPPSRFGELKMISLIDGTITKDWGQVHSDTILCVKLSPDGRTVATSGADKLVRLHGFTPEAMTRTLEGHTHHVLGIAWHDDGFLLASSSADNTVKVWDVEAGQATRTIAGFSKEVTSIAFVGRSNQLLSSAADNQLRLHDVSNGAHLRTFGGPGDSLYSLAVVSPINVDPTSLALGGGQEGVLWIWKVVDGAALKQLK